MKRYVLFVVLFIITPLANAQQDVTPPGLVSVSFCPTAIDTTQNDADVYVTLGATDDLSGVLLISAEFRSPSFKQVIGSGVTESLISGTPTNGVFRFRVAFPRYSELGTYTLRHITLQDKVLNSVNVETDTLRARGFPVQLINQAGASSQPCAGSSTAPLRITTVSLSSGVVGSAYSQTLAATGGVPPYSWTVSAGSLPPGLSLNPTTGIISGIAIGNGSTSNVTIMVRDSSGATASTSLQLNVQPPPLSRVGSFAQVASGDGWKTTITLLNLGALTVTGSVRFYGDNGDSLTLPISIPQIGSTSTTSAVDLTVAPGATFVIESESSGPIKTGWADVQASGPLTGYEIFRSRGTGVPDSEGTVPLDSSQGSSFVLPYDETSGFRTGISVVNLNKAAATIIIQVQDGNGVYLTPFNISLPPNGHYADFLYRLARLGDRGLIRFSGNMSAVGIRFNPSGSFTSIPIIRPSN